jgi:DHA1 family multidrug resistance protein-like MFS transporter
MVERAMFGGAVILFLMAFARSAEELILLRAIQGFITGTVAAANALVASTAPRTRTGYAMGLLQVGLGAGVALGPLIGGLIADAYGYQAAFYVTAALLLLSGILVGWGVEEDFVRPETPAGQRLSLSAGWRHVLAAPGVATTYAMRFISQMGRMMIVPIAPLFIQTLLPDAERLNTFTGLVVGIAAGATTISAVYLGRLGDRVGHRRVIILSALVATALYLVQSQVRDGWQLLVLQALVGVAMGGIIPTISALLAGFTQAGEAGAVYGLDNSIDSAGRSLAPLLGSAVAVWFSLRATFIATGLLFLLTGLLAAKLLPRVRDDQPIRLAS